MGKTLIAELVLLLAACVIVTGCAGVDRNSMRADLSTHPDRSCNPALVVNPVFLAPNDGVAGAGGPDLPGAGAAAYPGCTVY